MDAVINALEKRITALEQQILPTKKKIMYIDGENISSYLLETHGMITTALSCRESVAQILEELPTINEYLDPSCDHEDVAETKQLILHMYPDLKRSLFLLREYVRVRATLDAETELRRDQSQSVNVLVLAASDSYADSLQTKDEVKEVLKGLQEMTQSYKLFFAQMEYTIGLMEEAAKPKPVVDE